MGFFNDPDEDSSGWTLHDDALKLMLPFFRAAVESSDLHHCQIPQPNMTCDTIQTIHRCLSVQNNLLVIDPDHLNACTLTANDLLYAVHKACLRRIQQAEPLRNPLATADGIYHAPAFYFHYWEDDECASIRVSFASKPELAHFETALYVLQTEIFQGISMDRETSQQTDGCTIN